LRTPTQLNQLPAVVAELTAPLGPEATVAFVPLGEKLLPGDLIALRHAKKICDVVVAAQTYGKAPLTALNYIQQAGADVWLDALPSSKVGAAKTISVPAGDDLTYLMRLLLTVMPSAVSVSQENIPMMARMGAIHNTYEQFFTLLVPEVPATVLGERQLELTQAMALSQTLVDSGERQVDALLRYTLDVLGTKGFDKVTAASLYDAQTLQEVKGRLQADAFLYIQVDDVGKPMRQSLRIAI